MKGTGAMGMGQLGRYELLEELGRGAMGIVYRARDPVIDRIVAIKTIDLGLSSDDGETFERRFAREARTAGRLNHPNIVTIHDMGKCDNVGYIAMEVLPGRTLREILDSGVWLPLATVARIGTQIADGLAFAHRNGVVHCDVKPANIVVLDTGLVKITDFGIAKLPSGSRSFARNAFGSPRYIAPEQATGGEVDARSDLFSLGAVLYEMLTGTAAFPGTTLDEILDQVVKSEPVPPSQRNPGIPSAFDHIVARAMAKQPEHRYERAEDVAADLRKLAPESAELVPVKAAFHAAQQIAPARPGDVTVPLDATAEEPAVAVESASSSDAPAVATSRRRIVMYGVSAAVLALGSGWALIAKYTARRLDENAEAALPVPDAAPRVVANAEPSSATSPPASPSPGTGPGYAPSREAGTTNAATKTPAAKPKPAPAVRMGRLGFAVTPWGEIYVDGQKRGVSPPLREITLTAGRHTIEIRNSSFPPHRRIVELKADARIRIKHKFA